METRQNQLNRTARREMRINAELKNLETFQTLYNFYKNIYLNKRKLENLPQGVNQKYLFNALFEKGTIAFIKDKDYNFLALKYHSISNYNPYGDFLTVNVHTENNTLASKEYKRNFEYLKTYNEYDTCYIIDDNYNRFPPRLIVESYCLRIADLIRTIDIKVKQSKLNCLISCSEETKSSIEQAIANIDINLIATYVRSDIKDALIESKVENVNNDLNAIALLFDTLNNYRNELHMQLGINSISIDKKERLTSSEADINQDIIMQSNDFRNDCFTECINNINKIYDLDIKVINNDYFSKEERKKENVTDFENKENEVQENDVI